MERRAEKLSALAQHPVGVDCGVQALIKVVASGIMRKNIKGQHVGCNRLCRRGNVIQTIDASARP